MPRAVIPGADIHICGDFYHIGCEIPHYCGESGRPGFLEIFEEKLDEKDGREVGEIGQRHGNNIPEGIPSGDVGVEELETDSGGGELKEEFSNY